MTDNVRPVSAVSPRDRRAAERRATERRGADVGTGGKAASPSRDLVPVGEVEDQPRDAADPAGAARARPETPGSAAAFAAQLMGQGGQRNGIKGGPPVLDAARSTYLGAEYSGEKERRPPVGTAKRTDI